MKYKKVLITTGSLSAFTMPLAFVLSCGSNTTQSNEEVKDNKEVGHGTNGEGEGHKDPYWWVKKSPRIIERGSFEWEDEIKIGLKRILDANIIGYSAIIENHNVLIMKVTNNGVIDTYLIPAEVEEKSNKLIVFKNGILLPEDDPISKLVSKINL